MRQDNKQLPETTEITNLVTKKRLLFKMYFAFKFGMYCQKWNPEYLLTKFAKCLIQLTPEDKVLYVIRIETTIIMIHAVLSASANASSDNIHG